jgi:hypothetical protein
MTQGRLLEQDTLDPIHDVTDIILTRPKISVVHLFKHGHERVVLEFECPFGVTAILGDQANGFLGQSRILEHQ